MKLFGVCPMIFSFKEKGFPRKFLCSYVVVLLLYLLKFIHSYIEFFPTQLRLITSLTHTQWTWSYFSSLNAFSIVFKPASSLCDTPKYTYNKYYEHYKNAYIKPNIAISLKENNTNMSSLRDWIRSKTDHHK